MDLQSSLVFQFLLKASYNYPSVSSSSFRVQAPPRYPSYSSYSSGPSYPSYSSSSSSQSASSGSWYPYSAPNYQSPDSYQSQPVYNAIINDGLVTSSSSIYPSSPSSSSSSASSASSPSSSSSGSSYFLSRRSKAAPAFQRRSGSDIETNEKPAWQGT